MTEQLKRKFSDRLTGEKHGFALRRFGVIVFICMTSSCGHAKVTQPQNVAGNGIAVTVPQEAIGQGRYFAVHVDGAEASNVQGTFQGHKIEFYSDSPGTSSALVGVEVEMKPGTYPLVLQAMVNGKEFSKTEMIHVSEWKFHSETLKVPPRKVAPLARDIPKIQRDQAVLKKAYAFHSQKKFWDPPLTMPVDNIITSVFGTRRVFNGIKQSAHYGTDLRAAVGTPVKAPISGRVALAEDLFFTGGTVILDHGYGFFSIYGHMSQLSVKAGSEVKKGELLGLSGKTGRSSGPHLHWGVILHGVKIDPMALVSGLK